MRRWALWMVCCALVACENDATNLQQFSNADERLQETGRDVTLIYSDSAVIKTRIWAPLMVRTPAEDPVTEMPEGIRAIFFDEAGVQTSLLTANSAIQYPKRGVMEAHGDVVVLNEQGDTLFTEKLVWMEREERIFSDQYVRIVRPDEIIYGDGLESNQDFTRYKILNIRGTIALNE